MDVNPYQAPTAAPEHASFAPSAEPYVDQGDRVRLLCGLLIVGAVASAVSMGSTWLEMDLLERAKQGLVTMEEAEANDSRQQMIALGQVVLYLLTVVIFGIFLHRANKNARALSNMPLSDTPGWTVGWFFVPFANLYKPYQSVREIWEHSKGAVPLAFALWWAAWIANNALGQIAFRMRDPDDSIPELLAADQVSLVQELVGIAAALLAMWMVRSLHDGQRHHHQTGTPQIPAP